MVDWFSWVLIGLMVFFFGKKEYSRSQLDSYKEHDLDKSKDGYASEYFQKEQNKYMAYFAIIFVVFLLRESMLSG